MPFDPRSFDMKLLEKHYAQLSALIPPSRVAHSIRVAEAAVRIALKCLPEHVDEIRVAALLHDVAKGCMADKALDILKTLDGITQNDIDTPSVHHALIAPVFISEYFSEFATKNVLSSAFNHTTGDPEMSVFDQIIFVADYIEDGREHVSCVIVRERLYGALEQETDTASCVEILRRAVKTVLEQTVSYVRRSSSKINLRTLATLNAFSSEEAFDD